MITEDLREENCVFCTHPTWKISKLSLLSMLVSKGRQ